MTKCMKFMTPLQCLCGAKGDLVWSEEENPAAPREQNFEIVSVTELFTVANDTISCRLCDRRLAHVESEMAHPDKVRMQFAPCG